LISYSPLTFGNFTAFLIESWQLVGSYPLRISIWNGLSSFGLLAFLLILSKIIKTKGDFWQIKYLLVGSAVLATVVSPFSTWFHSGFTSVYSSTQKMEVICSSETPVEFQRTTQHHIPEHWALHVYPSFRSSFLSYSTPAIWLLELKERFFGIPRQYKHSETTLTNQNCIHEEIQSRLNSGNIWRPFCSEYLAFLFGYLKMSSI
jgi:hypothetical protein